MRTNRSRRLSDLEAALPDHADHVQRLVYAEAKRILEDPEGIELAHRLFAAAAAEGTLDDEEMGAMAKALHERLCTLEAAQYLQGGL